MTKQDVFAYARQQYGAEPDYPWGDDNAVLRHAGGKWFGVVLTVAREKLGLPGIGPADVLNVKCDPLLIGSLRLKPGYHPAYHMNKERWISIRLDGTVPEADIRRLIDLSFTLTAPKYMKGEQP